MSLPSPGPETLLGAKILIRDNYDNTLYTGLSEKKNLKRLREGGPDPDPIRLDGDWTTEDPAQGCTESQSRDCRERAGGGESQCRTLCEGEAHG